MSCRIRLSWSFLVREVTPVRSIPNDIYTTPQLCSQTPQHCKLDGPKHRCAPLPRPRNYVPVTVIVRKDDTKPGFHWFQKSSLIVFNELRWAQSSVFSLPHSLFPSEMRGVVLLIWHSHLPLAKGYGHGICYTMKFPYPQTERGKQTSNGWG